MLNSALNSIYSSKFENYITSHVGSGCQPAAALDTILQLVYHISTLIVYYLEKAMRGEAISSRPAVARGQVDRTALRVNQALIIMLLTIGFVFDQPWLVVFVCVVMA